MASLSSAASDRKHKAVRTNRRAFQRGGPWGTVEYAVLLGALLLLMATVWLAQNYKQFRSSGLGDASESLWKDRPVNITLLRSAVEFGAVCLDGSSPAYYLDPGFGEGADDWIVHMEGGGWCASNEDCFVRASSHLGSSSFMADGMYFGGILSSNPKINPEFYNWNRVMLKYCDGGSMFGDVDEAVHVKKSLRNRSTEANSVVYYRGMRVWNAVINDLLARGMAKAKKGFLTGCSAGGLATFLHCDLFSELMPTGSIVKCLSDAGFFLHINDVAGKATIGSFFEKVVSLQNITGRLPKDCTSTRNPAQCIFPKYLLETIKTPFFIVNPAYDDWQFSNELIPATADPSAEWVQCKRSLSRCSESQLSKVQGFRDDLLDQLNYLIKSTKGGAFIVSCYGHCQLEHDRTWNGESGPKIKGKSIREAVGEWYKGDEALFLLDCPFPCNPTCLSD